MAAVAILPPLREELTVHPGLRGADGAPTWTLHDPLRNQFFRLSWPAFEMLSRWHLGEPGAVAEQVRHETTLEVEAEDVADMVDFLARGQLLQPAGPEHTRRLLAIARSSRTSWAEWLLHHYLFFRVPLVRPDRMLEFLLPWVAWLGGPAFRLASVAALLAGVLLVGRQWNVFATTLVDQFSITGLAAFGVALGLAKIVHELGHALTAKAFGLRVPTMGVAFLVLMPVLYTDVNEAWKLPDRRRRLLIGGAGVLSELTLAAWATLAWALLPDGTGRQMAFTLAATTWISSLLINLSPFMRFDGYFLLADALDMPNLHNRAFALARWRLREILFGLGEPEPEQVAPGRRGFLVVFAWAVWIYRLSLFLGIAVLVYHFFIKVVGILLFAVEIGWFVIRPMAAEIKEWGERADAIKASRWSRWTLGGAGLLVLLALVPWNGRVSAPAMLKAAGHVVLYPPGPAILKSVGVRDETWVEAGSVLAVLDNPEIDYRLVQAARRMGVLKYELSSVGFEDSFRDRSQAIARELEAVQAEHAALLRDKARLTLKAPIAGWVSDTSPNLFQGQWLNQREALMAVRAPGAIVEAYVAEDDLPRIRPGAKALFLAEGARAGLPAAIVEIDRTAVRGLADPALAVQYGGTVPARFVDKALVPDVALYRVRLSVAGEASEPVMQRGEVHLDGEGRSVVERLLRAAATVVIREWGV
ncbi:putative Peptidase family M50 [Magnetospirillum sp. XM-1]|uniref:HlyD family efflux transporter periplasmic adaptor subunit n=1 Tax=Magnetospirillum sp. XM-1 TaxID=1663591 RepID=UPI00073DE9F4|nr:HlyD family efflux transporter periplasmic adaptor subunit [Magnetospirillum sp. XM-1]CUW39779.1 putative Peptidase family M50 [Magnetospirillum sp. XM-1]